MLAKKVEGKDACRNILSFTYLRKASNVECCQWSCNTRSTGSRGNDWLEVMPGNNCPLRWNNMSYKVLVSLAKFCLKSFSCEDVIWALHTSLREKKLLILFF